MKNEKLELDDLTHSELQSLHGGWVGALVAGVALLYTVSNKVKSYGQELGYAIGEAIKG